MSEPPLSQADYDALADAWNAGPVCDYFGFRARFVAGERVIVEVGDIHAGKRGGKGSGAINGGILAALFDFSIGLSTMLVAPTRRSATVQLSIQLMRGVMGESARCETTIDRETSSMIFATARLFDEAGVVCGQCIGISALGKPRTFDEVRASLRLGH